VLVAAPPKLVPPADVPPMALELAWADRPELPNND
jgi:hypothetical protein